MGTSTAPLTSAMGAWGSLTFKDGADALPDGDGARPVELPQCQLHVEEGHPSKHSHQCVEDEEGSCGVRSRAAVSTMAPHRQAVGGGVPGSGVDEGFGHIWEGAS